MPARNMLEQLLAVYTNPESHNAQRHRQTDGQQGDVNSRSYWVAVRSAKNCLCHKTSELMFRKGDPLRYAQSTTSLSVQV